MPNEPLGAVVDFLWEISALKEFHDHSDGQLLERFIGGGDESAFAVLVHRHGPMVFSVCQRVIGDVHHAEDAFQATFLVLARRAAVIRRNKPLANWLYGVAQRVALKARVKATASQQGLRELRDMPQADSLDETTWQVLSPILDEEIGRLPHRCRAPIVLCYLEGKSYDEAARELGCPKSSLASRLERGRELLRRSLAKRGFTLTASVLTAMLAEKTAGAAVAFKLCIKTVKGAVCFASGMSAAGIASTQVITLAEKIMAGIVASKLKVILAAMTVSLVLGGTGLAGYRNFTFSEKSDKHEITADDQKKVAAKPSEQAKLNAKPGIDIHGDPLPAGALARFGTLRFHHDGLCYFAEMLPDRKRVISASKDNTIRAWDYPSGKEIWRIKINPKKQIQTSNWTHAVTKDGHVIATAISGENEIYFHDIENGKELQKLIVDKERSPAPQSILEKAGTPTTAISGLAFDPEGKMLACHRLKHVVSVWEWRSGKLVKDCEPPPTSLPAGTGFFFSGGGGSQSPYQLAYSPDGKWLAAGNWNGVSRTLNLWETEKWTLTRTVTVGGMNTEVRPVFSPDNRMLVCSATINGALVAIIFDVATGNEIAKIPAQNDAFSFGPDSTKLYCGSNSHGVTEWDFRARKLLNELSSSASAHRVSLSSDGKKLTMTGDTHSAQFLDLATGGLQTLELSAGLPLLTTQFSVDGEHLLTLSESGGNSLHKWETNTGKYVGPINFPAAARKDLPVFANKRAFARVFMSSDGNVLAGTQEDSRLVTFVEFGSSKILGQLTIDEKFKPSKSGPFPNRVHLQFSHGSKLVAIADRLGPVELYDANSLKLVHRLARLNVKLRLHNIVFSADDSTLAVFSSQVELWDTRTGKATRPLRDSKGPIGNSEVGGAFSPDGRSLAVELMDGRIEVYELPTAQLRITLGKAVVVPLYGGNNKVRESSNLQRVTYSLDGKLIVQAGSDKQIHIWEITTGNEIATLKGHTRCVNAVAFSPDGLTLASASDDGTALLWDLRKLVTPMR